ncbi:penicillin-binding protein 2 [Nocardioides sp. Y6]|uniref:Penicillin-binding protein 2 n=1 Tax=Nocardioides malaquae TaxID=2773426 RepID=A0ABR9RNS6_9ACTN|nr:penicillin-binding protein 2 [Nocardioides malaquae]MBE7323231.1 penicillin-binding protein 2 [Nocardioides malaquae]
MPRTSRQDVRPRGGRRASPAQRLQVGLLLIAVVLSFFAARLLQLQGLDPRSYADMATAKDVVEITLPAARGDILDRNGVALADSVNGRMIIADPFRTADQAPELATLLADELDLDYFTTLEKLRKEGSRYQYVARRVPAATARGVLDKVREAGFVGISADDDPIRDYPAGEVAANLVGFMGTDEPLGGFEVAFNGLLSGREGSSRYTQGNGYRVPLAENSMVAPVDGDDLRTTIDRDLQWYTQKVLSETVENYRAESGVAVVQDARTGELLAVADAPTFDANEPLDSHPDNLGSRAFSDVYEPGSVQKVLTAAALVDAGKVTARTRLRVPGQLQRQDRPINDWFPHGVLRMTMAGVIAQSSNIGTVLAADQMSKRELWRYLRAFGLGRRTDVGVRGESRGLLTAPAAMTSQNKDRIAFGQSLSVNAVQMTAAINTIANGGVRVSPSLVQGSATTDDGRQVGTDHTTRERVVSPEAARQTMLMMERVVDAEAGVAPRAQVPGYRVAGKTGTAQRADEECGCYDGSLSLSFGGFAPADDPRFTVYVVIHAPGVDGGGGSVGGPAFSKIMARALSHYGVPPTGKRPNRVPVEW